MTRFYWITGCLLLLLAACAPNENILTDSGVELEFSSDTLTFDTVFTSIGSATRILKVYNPNKQPIIIDRISIRNAESSFRLNIDGVPTSDTSEVFIAAEDSLYIFGEVTVDPDQDFSVSPFVISDAIVFNTNGNEQEVTLEAWGQNAIYLPNRFSRGRAVVYTCDTEWVWDDPRPYVIYGIIQIEECRLRIPAGARVYVHGGLASTTIPDPENMLDSVRFLYNDGRLVIGQTGSLVIDGTQEDSVVIQGDRLEPSFQDELGQWYGIIFQPGSRGNRMTHAVVKNSILGVAVDSAAELRIENSQIYNTSSSGLIGIRSTITAENLLMYDNASGALRLVYGGDYQFRYCTFANYGFDAAALSMSNALCLNDLCTEYRPYRLNTTFINCIFTGSRRDELSFGAVPEAGFNYNFDHCILRIDELDDEEPLTNFLDDCNNCIVYERSDTLFASIEADDYHLDTLSIAEERARPIFGIDLDLDGVPRDAMQPDIGCYEYEN